MFSNNRLQIGNSFARFPNGEETENTEICAFSGTSSECQAKFIVRPRELEGSQE
jgi:hypothetical protein